MTTYWCRALVAKGDRGDRYAEHSQDHVKMELTSMQGRHGIDIFSEYLQHAIRNVVSYWPGFGIRFDPLTTCADIGTGPEKVEDNLWTYFRMAKSWGALVLIDEAEIYMGVSIK